METIVEEFRKKGKLFKKMRSISPKELGIRNRINIYKAIDLNGYFWAIFSLSQKTRILLKDVAKFEEIYKKLVLYSDHNYKYKVIYIDAPLCSKAKKGFQELGWRVNVIV
ncbi:MAG: hypothetical protein GXO11_08140 [Epsilonproteobacteria bacterium]|nr:hypothetical protein [Campylobacterota bacterium]